MELTMMRYSGPAVSHIGPAESHIGSAVSHIDPAVSHIGPAVIHIGPAVFVVVASVVASALRWSLCAQCVVPASGGESEVSVHRKDENFRVKV